MKKICCLFAAALCCLSCEKYPSGPDGGDTELSFDPVKGWPLPEFDGEVEHFAAPEPPFEYTVTYEYDKSGFCNPERGSYHPLEYHFRGGIPEPYSLERLSSARNGNCTLHYLGVYLCDYLESDIPQEALDVLRTHFEREREAGTKVVLRHAYSWDNKWPVQEPELKWILRHIEQLGPVWREYEDVIYVVQAGFFGCYGEWHTTTHINTSEERAAIVKSILDNLPESRQVAVRTPAHKRKILQDIYGRTFTLADSVTAETAFDGSYKSRIAGHSDCIFANSSDGGSFQSPMDLKLWRREGAYTSLGGESCFVGDYSYCGCAYSNKHMRKLQWSYLSNHYAIVDHWRTNGCNDDLERRVGYRLVFNGASFYGRFSSGEDFLMKLCLTNYGFASLINERRIELILVNDNDPSEKYVYISRKDPRDWKGCHHYEYDEKLVLPASLKSGQQYTLYMNLPDISPELHDDCNYSVRIASRGVWDENTGYNRIAAFIAE